MLNSGWRGYISSREIGGSIIPHRVQNLVIRDYAQKKTLSYLLSAVEYAMPGSFMMLKMLMGDLEEVAGVIFYATHLLPENDTFRHEVYDKFLSQGKGLCFALEDLAIQSVKDIALIEDIILVRRLAVAPVRIIQHQ